MKILIAGLGSIGRRHLRNLLALGEKDILLYRTHKSTIPDEELAPFPTETDLSAALDHHPDAVIVANPTALHMDVALPAARAGCHLLIEKPVADKWGSTLENLSQVTRDRSIKTLVGFQFRFHPVLQQIKTILDTRALGRLYTFRIHWGEYLPGWHPWEDYRQSYAARRELGGGVVNTLCHPLDYTRWLFGEVHSLSAVTSKVSALELDVEDAAEITVMLESGALGSIHLDYLQRPPAHWLSVNCEKGHIHWDNETGCAKIYHAGDQRWEYLDPPDGFERNTLFLDEMHHFLDLIFGGAESHCSLVDGIMALKLTEAVHESNRTHQQIIF
jgi:predicted dehydrogenase